MSLPITTIYTDNGEYVAKYGTGGTPKSPYSIGGGFYTIDLLDEMGILISTNGVGQQFNSIHTDKKIIYTKGSISNGAGVNYIPDNPVAYRRYSTNEIMDFEVIPVLFFNEAYLPPEQARIDIVKRMVREVSGVGHIDSLPRMSKFLEFFEDKSQPLNTPFGDTDMGWLLSHWHHTMGGQERVGWYDGVCTRGSGGFDNWHYDGLEWLALNYMNNPNQRLFEFGYQQAMAHTCYGRTWSGPTAGFARYEKGNEFIGENFSDKAWEKQWSNGLIIWWLLTENPAMKMQIDMMREQLKNSNPDTVWKGYWGARIGAHYLDELLAHYLVEKEDWIIDKAAHFMRNCLAWRAPDLCWDNRGSRKTESPWMQTQLVTSMFKWIEQVPDIANNFPIRELLGSGAAIWNKGHITTYGKPMLLYRFRGATMMPRSMHITAFAVPMLRYMAAHDPRWVDTHKEVHDFVYDYAGSDIAGIVSEIPTPLGTLGYRFPREGPGWSKALRNYLVSTK